MMKNNFFIVMAPNKFLDFYWDFLQLDEFSNTSEIQVWDLSNIISPHFAAQIKGQRSKREEVINIDSIINFISHLRVLIKENKENNICILYELNASSPIKLLIGVILNFYIKSTDVKVFDQFCGGIPISSPTQKIKNSSKNVIIKFYKKFYLLIKYSTNFREVALKVISYVSNVIGERLPTPLTHRFVAGRIWHTLALQSIGPKTKVIFGHSHDYSNYITASKSTIINTRERKNTSVFLDSAGPLFSSDSASTKRTVFFTSEVWYPALTQFFDYIEGKTGTIVDIAGHYMSNHISPAPCFGNRNVMYSLTREMVQQSEYVITRGSTSISYAVIYRKPVLFIYSNQLLQDAEAMRKTNIMADLLGTTPVNIDDLPDDIESHLSVNEDKYATYESDFLTSDTLGRSNAEIIMEDIMGISEDQIALSKIKL
jgi:hypothetical protein